MNEQHDRLAVEKRLSEGAATRTGQVRTSDIARLMELFQVCHPPSTYDPILSLKSIELLTKVLGIRSHQ